MLFINLIYHVSSLEMFSNVRRLLFEISNKNFVMFLFSTIGKFSTNLTLVEIELVVDVIY